MMLLKKAIPFNSYFNIHKEKENKKELEREINQVIDEIWVKFDKDNSGSLNKKECLQFFNESIVVMYGESRDLSDKDFETAFKLVDQNNNGQVSRDEMREFVKFAAGIQ